MTLPVLHRSVAGRLFSEQMRVARRMLHDEGIVLAVFLLLFSIVLVYHTWINPHSTPFGYDVPGNFLPMLGALVVSLRIWQGEEPRRRSYHSTVPISPSALTLMKVAAGWLWLLIGVMITTVWSIGETVVAQYIAHHTVGGTYPPFWHWAIPFGAASIVYYAVSIATVGSNYPWRWLLGASLACALTYGVVVQEGFVGTSRESNRIVPLYWSTVHGPLGAVSALWGVQAAPFTVVHVKADTTFETISSIEKVRANITIDSVVRRGYVPYESQQELAQWYALGQVDTQRVSKSLPNKTRVIGTDYSSVSLFPSPYVPSMWQWLKAFFLWISIGVIGVCVVSYNHNDGRKR